MIISDNINLMSMVIRDNEIKGVLNSSEDKQYEYFIKSCRL